MCVYLSLFIFATNLVEVIRNIGPTNWWQRIEHSKLNSSLEPWRQFFQNPHFISQGCNEMVNIKNVLKLTVTQYHVTFSELY